MVQGGNRMLGPSPDMLWHVYFPSENLFRPKLVIISVYSIF